MANATGNGGGGATESPSAANDCPSPSIPPSYATDHAGRDSATPALETVRS
jgi:hypothetical protein